MHAHDMKESMMYNRTEEKGMYQAEKPVDHRCSRLRMCEGTSERSHAPLRTPERSSCKAVCTRNGARQTQTRKGKKEEHKRRVQKELARVRLNNAGARKKSRMELERNNNRKSVQFATNHAVCKRVATNHAGARKKRAEARRARSKLTYQNEGT